MTTQDRQPAPPSLPLLREALAAEEQRAQQAREAKALASKTLDDATKMVAYLRGVVSEAERAERVRGERERDAERWR